MPTASTDLREELVRSLKGEYVENFHFATEEDESQIISSLTNSAVPNFIALEEKATNLVVRYTIVKTKETAATRTYKIEIIRTGTKLALVVTDVATDKPVDEIVLPEPERHDEHTFDSINECVAEFDSSPLQIALQAEANRTCENQYPHLLCCLRDDSCFSVVLIIRPTLWTCRRVAALPHGGLFVLKRQ